MMEKNEFFQVSEDKITTTVEAVAAKEEVVREIIQAATLILAGATDEIQTGDLHLPMT